MQQHLNITPEQAITCVTQCQKLTSLLKQIHIVRLDERTGDVYVLAGDDIGIIIFRDGKWEFD